MTPASLLCLLRLASPALPVGCYAYSQGLEWAVGSGAVQDEDGLERWLAGILRHCLATLDLPLLARLHRAWKQGDRDEAWRLDREVLAWRDSREARLEETQTGNALAKVLADSGVEAAQASRGRATYLGMFALACAAWGIPERECLLAFAWSFAENQTLAGVKLIPLGQTAGQRILAKIARLIPDCAQAGQDAGSGLPHSSAFGRSLAQLRHERQGVRLFRS